jgi:NAD-dependent deacetylase
MGDVMDDAMLAAGVRQAAAWLGQARRVVVLTGAGISQESGIPTFREAQTGLWARYDPMELASPEGFARNPGLVWRWYLWRRGVVAKAAPNAGHVALVELARLVPELAIVTQNVDGLHQAAGSQGVIELHGSLQRFRCQKSGHLADTALVDGSPEEPPRCPQCDSLVRPDVVWFGEMLPPGALEKAVALAHQAEVMLVVGTSGMVQPAASLPLVAAKAGARVIEINPDETPLTPAVDLHLHGPGGVVLPRIVAQLRAA